MLGYRLVYQGIIHDITQIKQLEREKARNKQLAIIGEMAARIAHEIKNPLASIQTGIQLLESQVNGNTKQKTYFERLCGEIKRVDSILKGLLTYARDDQLNLKSIQIARLIKRFQAVVMPSINNHKLELDMKIYYFFLGFLKSDSKYMRIFQGGP